MVLDVVQKTVENGSLLLDEEVLESRRLLLDQHSLHDLVEVTAQDGQTFLVALNEGAQFLEQGVVEFGLFGLLLLLFLLLGLAAELGLFGFSGLFLVALLGFIFDILGLFEFGNGLSEGVGFTGVNSFVLSVGGLGLFFIGGVLGLCGGGDEF